MSRRGVIRLATRGSALALRQAATVKERLADRRTEVELVEVETAGDEIRDELIHRLGTTGAFVRSLDEQVLAGEVDAAVHSLKDVPTEAPESLVVAAVPERAAAHDVLVTPDGRELADLPEGGTVGTSSLRRGAQLLAERPDLTIEPLRGNVDTRVEKLLAPHRQREHERRIDAAEAAGDSGDDAAQSAAHGAAFDRSVEAWFDDHAEVERRALERDVDVAYAAIVLAATGLERIGLAHHVPTTTLPPTTFVPAPGQGALAVVAVDGEGAGRLNDALDHPRSRVETTVERTILAELGGGCVAPLGAHAVLEGSAVAATVRVLSRDGTEEVAATRELPVERHVEAAVEFAADLAERGAGALIERAARETGDAGEGASAADADAATARERREDADRSDAEDDNDTVAGEDGV
jgi:hydroxymethylbilane synthase